MSSSATISSFVPAPHANADTHAAIMEMLSKMSDEQFFATLVTAGVYDEQGALRPEYAAPSDGSARPRQSKAKARR
ncbi:MAG: hypothetical protein HYV07_14035 [Deltaproteobacteria bacterium]|nr:hypothetical protein [Deltaproteobacteria bacterium]